MSGGFYNYEQHRLEWLAESIKEDLTPNAEDNIEDYLLSLGISNADKVKVLQEINIIVDDLIKLKNKIHSLDYMLSGDITYKQFLKNIENNSQLK